MIKKLRIYQISLIAVSMLCVGLLAFMGITAIQKAMRLNVGLTVTPIAKVELYITPEGGSETLLLRNFSEGGKDVATGSGVTFSNNTVSYSGTYNDFTIRAVNFTDSTPLLLNLTGYGVDIEGEETYQQTLGVANSANSSFTFNLTSSAMMPGTNNATLKMQFVVNSAKLSISTTGCTYTGGASTLSEENPSTYINFTLENAYQSGYALNYNITGVESGGYTWNKETGYFVVTDWSKVTSDIVVSAYVSKLYTVTLDSTGGSLGGSNTITGTAGSELGALLTPSKTGYIFKGWFTATSGGTQVTSTSQIPENGATYYAQWTPITYTIAYNNPDNSGGSTASSTHTYDVAKNLTANGFTAPSGKRFSGWAETSGGAVKYTDGQSVNNLTTTNGATITLYAVWEDSTYTITFASSGNGAQATGVPGEVERGGSLTLRLSSSQSGYSSSAPIVDGDCSFTYTYDVSSNEFVLSLTKIMSNINVSSIGLPWKYYAYGNSGAFAGYTYIKFLDDDAEWVIIGSGDNLISSLFNSNYIVGYNNGYGKEYTYNSQTLIGPNPNPIDNTPATNKNPNGKELLDNQILLLRRQILSTQSFRDHWQADFPVATFLNSEWTALNNYKPYMTSPTLYSASREMGYSGKDPEMHIDENNGTQIFVLATKILDPYGACLQQNFMMEDYLGTFVSGDTLSNPRVFSFDTGISTGWGLRTGTSDPDDEEMIYVSSTGTLTHPDSPYTIGVRPCFVLNLAENL